MPKAKNIFRMKLRILLMSGIKVTPCGPTEVKKENAERVYERSLENFKDEIISIEEFEDKKFQLKK